MSTILQQMAEKQLRKTSEVNKRFTKSQQVVRYVPNIMKPKSQSQFRDRLIDGNYSIQVEIKKSVLDDIFQKIGPNFRREHLEYVTMQFESELVRVCNEFSQTELISKHSSFNIGFSKFMKQLLVKYDEMVQQVQLLQNTCNTQQQSHNQLTEQCKNLQLLLDKQVPDKKVQNTKEAAKRQNEIYMENLRLKNEVDRIKDRLKHFENVTNVQNLIQEIEQIKANSKQQINDLVSEIQLKDKQLQKLNLHYQNLKSQYSKLENESKAYQTIFEQNKIQLNKVTILNQKNESNMLKYREIALMQREDMDMRAFIVKEHLMVAQKAKDKLVQLQTKLDRFQIEKSKEIEPQPNRNFDQEKSGFDRLNDLLSNDKTFHRLNYQALVADKARVMVRIGHSVQVMEQFFNSQEIQLDKLTIGYINFNQHLYHFSMAGMLKILSIQYALYQLNVKWQFKDFQNSRFLIQCYSLLQLYVQFNIFIHSFQIFLHRYIHLSMLQFQCSLVCQDHCYLLKIAYQSTLKILQLRSYSFISIHILRFNHNSKFKLIKSINWLPQHSPLCSSISIIYQAFSKVFWNLSY